MACWLLGEYAESSTADFESLIPMIIKDLVQKFHDPDPKVLLAAVTSLEKVRGGVGGARTCRCFFLMHMSHSISFTRAQGVPKYKIGFGRGKGWESWGKIG